MTDRRRRLRPWTRPGEPPSAAEPVAPLADEGSGLQLEELRSMLGTALGRDLGSCRASTRFVAELRLDELEVCDAVAAMEAINPSFFLPHDADVMELTLGDLHFYCQSMTRDHHAR